MGDFNFTSEDPEYRHAVASTPSWSRQTVYRHHGLGRYLDRGRGGRGGDLPRQSPRPDSP